ncbi:DUF2490 domain-containing protein [Chitinophaga qingshengii]|uniref:DUF2490 domain-containing protein n=1 Tax=Chitinophaga qingshengii TaxID=1569794 RepID=A0ABR7TGZ0_9BACT|nr:DUF2490 domain-containing protein [Chitinophaga qingshengii]MBC9929752.1 DUF2490 domain-containing protein [Chitinophaga qingshengii]
MPRFKRWLIIAIWIAFPSTLTAQNHHNAWLRGTLGVPLSEKLKTDIEFQHRRQNGFQNMNMLDQNLMFSIRPWIHYQYRSNLKFSASPFSYFSHYRIIQDKADNEVTANSEVRVSIAEELQHKISRHIYLLNRNALEYRIFNSPQPNITRFRTRFGGQYELTGHVKLALFDEFFINLAGTSAGHIPDHNRTGFNIEYNVSPQLKFDLGYIYLVRFSVPTAAGNIRSHENNIFLHLTYQLKNNK